MNIHEYQAKEILSRFGVTTQQGIVAATPEEAEKLIRLYEQERLQGFLDTAYGYTALAYNAVGDARRATKYARLAADAAVLKGGPGAPLFRTWKEVIDNPKGHWSWRWRLRG